jgi:hypothetical protein
VAEVLLQRRLVLVVLELEAGAGKMELAFQVPQILVLVVVAHSQETVEMAAREPSSWLIKIQL